MELWWPRATKDPGSDAGPFTTGRFKGVLHTTDGWSYSDARSTYAQRNSWPHFTVSFASGAFHAWQHLPINRAARALKHPKGTPETNRARAIQIEIVGFALEAREFPDAYLSGLARLMRWIEKQTGITQQHPLFKAYPASYGIRNGVRLSESAFVRFNGWCGHQHVPHNDHGDPGAIKIARLLRVPPPDVVIEHAVVTGCDRASPPTVAEANAIRRATGAQWWGVYIGGPCSGGRGWSADRVRQLGRAGFEFLPTYVGRQSPDICRSRGRGVNSAQGRVDGEEAARLMVEWGWEPGLQIPVCLDVEANTFRHYGEQALDYIAGWVDVVRKAGYRTGVYSSPRCLVALSRRPPEHRPAFVWIAAWVRTSHVNPDLNPLDASGMPRSIWRNDQRAWQYIGEKKLPGARSAVDASCSNIALAPTPSR